MSFFGLTSKPPTLPIENKKVTKYDVGDLVNYRWGNNITYMAIINEIMYGSNGQFMGYKINIIDKEWTTPLITIDNIKEDSITAINLHPEYNPDLLIEINNNDRIKKMIELKLGIKALKANIEFINNAGPNAFSDYAIGPKIKTLQGLQKQLTDLYSTPNIIEPTYVSYNTKLYGNIIVQISKYCDTLNLKVEIKEQIIENFLNVSNSLLSFTGITLGLNVLYYKLYGELLITSLFDKLPENIKQQIQLTLLQFLGIFIFGQRDFFYHLCNYPIDSIKNFYNLFNDNIIKLSNGQVNFSNNINNSKNNDDDDDNSYDNRSPKRRKTIFNGDEFELLSQSDDFETKCTTFKNDDIVFNIVNKTIFEELNSELSDINAIDESDISPLTEGGKRNKKTRKINKKRRLVRKTKKTNKSYKKNKKHNTKKHNTKRR
jgi:hypothetical protein